MLCLFDRILLKLAIFLEDWVLFVKKRMRHKALQKFLLKYNLRDVFFKKKTDRRYNSYEGTNLLLIDKLVQSSELNPEEKIMDVGCGSGIFMIYLASHGFKKLCGIEMDADLYFLCKENIDKFQVMTSNFCLLTVKHGNALELPIDDDIMCFYLFNPFFDEQTYRDWLKNLKDSLRRRRRQIKIILLYPTLAAMEAMNSCDWLRKKRRIICRDQICYVCVKFFIYESVI